MIALLEAGIDFADNDLDFASPEEILRRLAPVAEGVERLAGSFAYGRLVHDGLTLAIVGRPNVGKSSLFNRLLEQDRAIVTEIPGTTRDLVSETAALGGIPVKFIDTAGIRDSGDRDRVAGRRAQPAGHDRRRPDAGGPGSAPSRSTDDDRQLLDRARGLGRGQ